MGRTPKAPKAPPVEVEQVRLSHPDRVYWVDVGVSKQALAEYYADVWEWIAPHVSNRPLALVRCPSGTSGQCFFQKHVAAGIENQALRREVETKEKDVIAVETVEDLVSLVQSGTLEIHVRGSRLGDLERCDRIVFDIDPGPGVAWKQIVDAARTIRERLGGLGLESFVKLSGGKGLHVVLPVAPSPWDDAKAFAHGLALVMEEDEPDLYVTRMTKSLREGRIFIDWLRNSREATSVVAYSTRARAGAPVATPVRWDELGRVKSAAQYTVLNVRDRLRGLNVDPWEGMAEMRQPLPELPAVPIDKAEG